MAQKTKTLTKAQDECTRIEREADWARHDEDAVLDFSYKGLATQAAEAEQAGRFAHAEVLWRKAWLQAKHELNKLWAHGRMQFCAKAKHRPPVPASQAA